MKKILKEILYLCCCCPISAQRSNAQRPGALRTETAAEFLSCSEHGGSACLAK